MSLHIPNKVKLLSKLDGLRTEVKKKYINLGSKLLVFSVNSINHFAHHLIVLQDKDPNVIHVAPETKVKWKDPSIAAAVQRAVSDIRPSFNFGSSRGWSRDHFKNPEKYHPILVNRIKADENGILKASKEPENTLTKLKVVDPYLEGALNTLAAFDTVEAALEASLPKEDNSADVGIVSGTRPVTKKVSVKKVTNGTPKKKVVKVKRVKKGVFHRVED